GGGVAVMSCSRTRVRLAVPVPIAPSRRRLPSVSERFRAPLLLRQDRWGSRAKGDALAEVQMRIGLLTGGGDCPGLNAVIRAVVRKGEGVYGHSGVGFRHGWRGGIE